MVSVNVIGNCGMKTICDLQAVCAHASIRQSACAHACVRGRGREGEGGREREHYILRIETTLEKRTSCCEGDGHYHLNF